MLGSMRLVEMLKIVFDAHGLGESHTEVLFSGPAPQLVPFTASEQTLLPTWLSARVYQMHT